MWGKALFTCILDQDWSDSRPPWLDIVLLCLDGVEIQLVSWAVRYLDKPQWRTVYCSHATLVLDIKFV